MENETILLRALRDTTHRGLALRLGCTASRARRMASGAGEFAALAAALGLRLAPAEGGRG